MEQEQQYMNSSPVMNGNYLDNGSKSDLLDKIRPEEFIEHIKQKLMGKEYDESKDEWVVNPALKELALSEIGANSITNLMSPASTRSVSISNLKDDEIRKRLFNLVKTAQKMCLDNWRIYGIRHTSQFFFIKEIIYTNTLVVLKQSENEGIRRLLNSIISENRSVSTYGEEKSGGIFGLFRKR